MSTSCSDSDSDDDFEPIRRININIKPKSSVDNTKSTAAKIQELKASVESWRPLGPLPYASQPRRQSSLSSVSSMSMYGLHSSPSCSSLVNEFNSRSAFSNIISPSRTSSPLTVINHGDTIPIAVALQESIELLIKGTTRHESYVKNQIVKSKNEALDYQELEENLFGTYQEDIPQSGFSHDTNLRNLNDQEDCDVNFVPDFISRSMGNLKLAFPNAFARGSYGKPTEGTLKFRLSSTQNIMKYYASRLIKNTPQDGTNSKVFELDIDMLITHLKKLHEQSPASRYYNVDVLRYQIAPIKSISCCPIQICAYWKLEPEIIKLRIDFKNCSGSGISLDRFREISISVNLNDILSSAKNVEDGDSSLLKCKNNNSNDTRNMNELYPSDEKIDNSLSSTQSTHIFRRANSSPSHIDLTNNIISKPKAHWNHSIKQLTWKFDSLDSYQSTDGSGSLFAKIYRTSFKIDKPCHNNPVPYPDPVHVKFLVVDSTLSKVGFSIDSAGYKMTLLKREIRSGRYWCEPFMVV